ncbi:MAG: glycosyltransferase [Nitrospirae bacterium]|nr:glycosyltransferase [Nitrospirota bacterium]MCL5237673.1 glycosyltransferase [Nitrospirota bacterium]
MKTTAPPGNTRIKSSGSEATRLPFVSIIIPAYNEARFIGRCLQSIKHLDYPSDRFEIIVVDNGSADRTVEICREFTESIYVLRGVTISALRNYGAERSKGSIYAFIDADCTADRDWLRNSIGPVIRERCITGSKYMPPPDGTWIEKAWFSRKPQGRCEVTYINSGNLIVPAEIFRKTGGFNTSLITGEDYEFCLRAKKNAKIISDDSLRVTHLGNPKTLRKFLEREIWHGLGSFGSVAHNWLDKPLIGTFVFALLTVCQIAGLFFYPFTALAYSSAGIVLLLLLTVAWRRKNITSFKQGLQLFLLYYFYYLGRSISFIYRLSGRPFGRKK